MDDTIANNSEIRRVSYFPCLVAASERKMEKNGVRVYFSLIYYIT